MVIRPMVLRDDHHRPLQLQGRYGTMVHENINQSENSAICCKNQLNFYFLQITVDSIQFLVYNSIILQDRLKFQKNNRRIYL